MEKILKNIIFIIIPIFASVILALATIVFIYWFAYKLNKPVSNLLEDWAHFGDFFGGIIGSILTFLTLLTVILTLYYQREELITTRQELKESMRIASLQEESLRSQANAQNKSLFESGFMQMIEIHFRLIDSYKIGTRDGGQHFIQEIINLTEILRENNQYDFRNSMDYRMHRHLFHLSSIIDLIFKNSILTNEEQLHYLRIVQNVIGDKVIEFIRLTYHIHYLKSIREQLLKLCSDVA
ncbi:hypothetical protein [Leptospira paudalimensis]|uniref:Phage abortive infection protein n=1 Tax=Leptospira paudalimensis TaxID=2950024 RepID=A0ABT3M564_9LEPT|nr:hypothetical protein [Leptospira paudalimensis]MCW7503531.1 hypothetical protein [Leptospira paudalimensis]